VGHPEFGGSGCLLRCRDLLSSFGDCSHIYRTPRRRELQFVAVVVHMQTSSYGGHFPDLPGDSLLHEIDENIGHDVVGRFVNTMLLAVV